MNGQLYTLETFRQVGSFVEQDDVLFEASTPLELFGFAASMLLPDLSAEERDERVKLLIRVLRLEDCQNTPVGGGQGLLDGISTGERKRVSIGYDLIHFPEILILDEPTSGLDYVTALEIMKYLKSLCKSLKMTVICTLHQPSSQLVQLCDQVMCLSDGKLLYNGTLNASFEVYLKTHFSIQMPKHTNPADYLLKLANEPEKVKSGLSFG
jgi:ATP-binding cassette subfamily G (WHITE) protein 2